MFSTVLRKVEMTIKNIPQILYISQNENKKNNPKRETQNPKPEINVHSPLSSASLWH